MKYKVKIDCEACGEKLKKDQILYKYCGATYGCIGFGGVACTYVKDEGPFFEVPKKYLEECK